MKILVLFYILAAVMLSSSVLADDKCKKKSDCPNWGEWRCIDDVCKRYHISYPWENDYDLIRSFSSQSSSGTECTDKSDCPDRYVCWHDHKCHSVIEVMEGVTPEPDYGEGPNPEW